MIEIIIRCDRFLDAVVFARALSHVDSNQNGGICESTVHLMDERQPEKISDRKRRGNKKL